MSKQTWFATLFTLIVAGFLLGSPLGAAAQTPVPSNAPGPAATPLTAAVPTTASGVATSTAKPITRILFICDSNSLFMAQYLTKLAASADPPIVIEAVEAFHAGTGLNMQWGVWEEQSRIVAGRWDAVVLEEDLGDRWYGSMVSVFHQYVGKFTETIRQAGAQPVLHMVWGDRGLKPTTDDIAAAYTKAGTDFGIKVAPSGLAFERALKLRPDLDVRAPDGDHQGKYGCYLALCTLFATIFDRSPVGLTYRMPGTEGGEFDLEPSGDGPPPDAVTTARASQEIPEADAAFLRKVAWDTVVDYQAQK